MTLKIDKDAVRGELSEAVWRLIDWERLRWYSQEALLAQHHKVRSHFIDGAEQGDAGPIVNVEISPFDAEGRTEIRIGGHPLLLLHVSRLMPWSPVRLDQMKEVE